MKQPIRIFATIVLHFVCSLLHAEDRRPKLLVMFTDDQPQNCLGIIGNKHIQTPNLDRLAQRGVFFIKAFVTTAICCCNRACILTGQHIVRHGIPLEQFNLASSAEHAERRQVLRETCNAERKHPSISKHTVYWPTPITGI